MGVKTNATENLSLPEHARNHTYFNFDEKIQLSLQATVGSKLNFNMNYNLESSFDFDAKLKLAYEGEVDDIIKLLQAGDVSMSNRNSLIQGGASLFSIHSKMQFGKLDVDFVVSQQEARQNMFPPKEEPKRNHSKSPMTTTMKIDISFGTLLQRTIRQSP